MKQAWSKALGDLSTDQQGKILYMRFGNPTQVPDSLHTEATFDKLLKKHVMLCAYNCYFASSRDRSLMLIRKFCLVMVFRI